MIGWADNWDYAAQAPTADSGFRGKMTLAREMKLVKTEQGYRLSFSFKGTEALEAVSFPLAQGDNRLHSDTFGLKAAVKGTGKIVFRNSSGEFVEITVTEEEITVDRRHAGQSSFQQDYEKESYGLNRAPRQLRDSSEIEIIFDKCILEVLADNGLTPFTVSVFPLQPYEKIGVTGDIQAKLFYLC